MLKNDSKKEPLETIITQIVELLNEVKNEQTKIKNTINDNHKINMQKFAKLMEFNEISDMTNTVFERRIASIEKLLYEVFKGDN